eukprot:jgi/Mesen1/2652/ME000167S01808
MAADQNTVAAQGLWLLADEFEKEGCIPQQILLKQIPRGHLDLKATACNLLSRCYHLVGNTTLQKSILAKGLDLAEKQLAVDKCVVLSARPPQLLGWESDQRAAANSETA